jgi:two-component system sensor histidine kinase CiaH
MLIKRRVLIITIVYWIFLTYIIAALIFWFIALNNQNRQMTNYKVSSLSTQDRSYQNKIQTYKEEQKRKTTQYVSEGLTFLALIIFGAIFMYRLVRRQFNLQRQQENLMMAITHELKTPIAIAKLNLETLQKHQLDEAKKQKLLQMTLHETNRLNNLASNILVSAQLEAGKTTMKEELNFSDLVKNSVSEFANRFPDHTWNVSIADEEEVKGDTLLLQIMVNNLLENAVKYSAPGSSISCTLADENGYMTLRIADEGHGIPAEEKTKIFQKFYRIGSEQIRSAKGTGLGLYLCKKIAADHHAVIRVEDNIKHGSVFIVKFQNNHK